MGETTLRYRAFLSYSHRDTTWAKWLHKSLETYRIDKDMVGRGTPAGPVPKTLRPIFRDREDFSAGHSLTEQTLAALDASQFLVVICSPNAARSTYVDEEVRHFKALNRASRVIPVIVDGAPGDAAHECFPLALRFKVGPDGTLTDELEEPIAADARSEGDGKEIAKQKVVAGLLGLGLDEIMRRAERARKRRNRLRIAAISVAVIIVVGAAVGWTGALFVSARLNSANNLNDTYLAADLCEHGAELAVTQHVAETKRIALAAECVATLSDGLYRLPRDRLPIRLMSAFEMNLAILRKSKDQGKLTPEQLDVLADADTLASEIGTR